MRFPRRPWKRKIGITQGAPAAVVLPRAQARRVEPVPARRGGNVVCLKCEFSQADGARVRFALRRARRLLHAPAAHTQKVRPALRAAHLTAVMRMNRTLNADAQVGLGVVVALIFFAGIHETPTTYETVYYRGGGLLPHKGLPGFNWMLPYPFTTYEHVKVTHQTDVVTDVHFGSNTGSRGYFQKIEVVNRLHAACVLRVMGAHGPHYDHDIIYAYIRTDTAQFARKYTIQEILSDKYSEMDEILRDALRANVAAYNLTGCIEIFAVRVHPPVVDAKLRQAFEKLEHEGKLRDLEMKRRGTQRVQLQIQADEKIHQKRMEQNMSAIDQERQKQEALAAAERRAIEANATLLAQRLQADGELYAMRQRAAGHRLLYSDANYTHALVLTQLGKNSKEHFHHGLNGDPRMTMVQQFLSSSGPTPAPAVPDTTTTPIVPAFLEKEETQCAAPTTP